MNEFEFTTKVEHEGGVEGALEYGLKASDLDVDGELKEVWTELEEIYNARVSHLIERYYELEYEIYRKQYPDNGAYL